ncbi:hypothetical protein LguiB_033337 [Lonicera macranthoides]
MLRSPPINASSLNSGITVPLPSCFLYFSLLSVSSPPSNFNSDNFTENLNTVLDFHLNLSFAISIS